MKRMLLIGTLVLVALLAVSVPLGIGWLIENQARPALEQRLPSRAIQWHRGWFRSALAIDDAGIDADVNFRHLTASPPGWLAVDGRVVLSDPPTAIDVRGRVSLGLGTELEASAPSLVHGDRVRWRHDSPALRVVARDDTLRANGDGDTLVVDDPVGNRLVLANPDVGVVVEEGGNGDVAIMLTLEASRGGAPASRAVLRMDSVDPAAMEQLVQALVQLVSDGSDGLVAVGLASAWQQLGARGMVVTLEELSMDGALALQGRWAPGERSFTLTGGGERDALLVWWSTVAGLIRAVPPAEARAAAQRTLADFVDRGLVDADGDRLRVSLDSMPGGDPG